MSQNLETGVIYLHEYRILDKQASEELKKLLWKVLEKKYGGDILAFAEAFALAKAGEITLQLFSKGRVDRDEYYDSMIAWALEELTFAQQAQA